jgi:hypothetical protein
VRAQAIAGTRHAATDIDASLRVFIVEAIYIVLSRISIDSLAHDPKSSRGAEAPARTMAKATKPLSQRSTAIPSFDFALTPPR